MLCAFGINQDFQKLQNLEKTPAIITLGVHCIGRMGDPLHQRNGCVTTREPICWKYFVFECDLIGGIFFESGMIFELESCWYCSGANPQS